MTGIAPEDALGRVLHGTGDGAGHEGYAEGGLLGTHLHGPVLAKNPSLADAILRRALGDAYSRRTSVSAWSMKRHEPLAM